MSKGKILENKGGGLYSIDVYRDTDAIESRISVIDSLMSDMDGKIADLEDRIKAAAAAIQSDPSAENQAVYQRAVADRARLTVMRASMSMEKDALAMSLEYFHETTDAWCADLSEGLSGDVGLCDIPGENGGCALNIRPGFADAAAYSESRDGRLKPAVGMGKYSHWLMSALITGIRKWRPTYRYGTITAKTGDICNVDLDGHFSRYIFAAQNINREDILTDVPIEYMTCNGDAFEVGDRVVVHFGDFDWTLPRVIGFRDHPQPCTMYVAFRCITSDADVCFIWDAGMDAYAEVPLDDGSGMAAFPVETGTISGWMSGKSAKGVKYKYNPTGMLDNNLASRLDAQPDCWEMGTSCSGTDAETETFGPYIHTDTITYEKSHGVAGEGETLFPKSMNISREEENDLVGKEPDEYIYRPQSYHIYLSGEYYHVRAEKILSHVDNLSCSGFWDNPETNYYPFSAAISEDITWRLRTPFGALIWEDYYTSSSGGTEGEGSVGGCTAEGRGFAAKIQISKTAVYKNLSVGVWSGQFIMRNTAAVYESCMDYFGWMFGGVIGIPAFSTYNYEDTGMSCVAACAFDAGTPDGWETNSGFTDAIQAAHSMAMSLTAETAEAGELVSYDFDLEIL